MKKMDFIRVLLLMAVLVEAVAALGTAQSVNAAANGALSLVNLKISPQPIIAGQNVTILFNLYNSYSNPLNNAELQLLASNPIINVSPSSSYLINAIGQGIYGGALVGGGALIYTLHIPSTLQAGEYTIDVSATYQTSQPNSYGGTSVLPAESLMPINIYVYGTPAISLSANPQSMLVPGQSTSIPVTAVNTGTDIANNVTVTLHNSRYFKVFGGQQFSLGTIKPDASASFGAGVQPSLTIANGTYNISATVTYTAQSGKFVSQNTTIELASLINSPNIVASIASASPTNLYTGGNQTLQVQIQNIGLGTAKNVTARFLNAPGVNVGSTSQFFIATLPPKNLTTVSVYVSATRGASNMSSLSLPVSFRYYSSNYAQNISTLQNIRLNVQNSAVFNITSVSGMLTAGVAYKPLTFVIKNTGNEEADQISLSLQTTFPITPVNPNIYINSLAPGQSTNATFYVGVDPGGNAGSYPITVFEQWRQNNGAADQEFSGSVAYYATVSGSSGNTSSYEIIGVVVVIAIAGVVVYRMRKRKKGAKGKEAKGKE
ncbi:MAG: hypothetical protein ABSE71_03270 [Candidatus Micrarchaeaceae archaeon]|jgi:hypothetical protein